MAKLDERQALQAMRIFLEEFWEQNNRNADVAEVLSDIRRQPNHETHDAGAWASWLEAVAHALDENYEPSLLIQARPRAEELGSRGQSASSAHD